MAPEKSTTRHSTSKAPVSTRTARQLTTTRAAHSASGPSAPPAPDGLVLNRIKSNVVVIREKAAASPVSKPTFKVTLLGSIYDSSKTAFDNPAILDLLELVQQRHSVRVDFGSPFLNSLNISGSSPSIVRAAHNDVNGFVHRLKSSDQHELFMVQPTDDRNKRIALSRDINRPGLVRFFFEDEAAGKGHKSRDEKWRAQQTSTFRTQFAKLASILISVPSNLHMEVQLGRLLSHMPGDQKPANVEGLTARLNQALAKSAVDGSIIFDRRIGGTDMFREMQQQVFRSRDAFYPCSSVLESLLDVESQKFIVGLMEGFRFQLEIGPPGSAPDKRSASLSHLRVFQTLGSEGNAGLATACPNHNIDWKLETVAELVPEEIPSTIKSFLDGVTVVYPKEKGEFPAPIMRTGLSKDYRVKELFGKTAWTVGCKGSRYMLELSLCHKLPKSHLANEQDQCQVGVSILNSIWEEALKTPVIEGGPRDFGTNWDGLFSPSTGRGTQGDGIDVFLKLVNRVLTLWDKAHQEASRLTASRPAAEKESSVAEPPHSEPPQRSGPTDSLSCWVTTEAHNSSHLFVVPDNKVEEDLIIFD